MWDLDGDKCDPIRSTTLVSLLWFDVSIGCSHVDDVDQMQV